METKAVQTPGGSAAEAELMAAFEAYREANDARLAALESRGGVDPLIEARLGRLDRQLSDLSLKAAAPPVAPGAGPGADPAGDSRQRQAWQRYLREGETSGLAGLDLKALQAGIEEEGGYLAPPELDRLIEVRLAQSSPMRQVASVRPTSAGTYRKPVSLGAAAAWTSETAARPETQAPTLDVLDFPAGELYAMPAATQTLLQDAFADVDEWLADEVEGAFAAQESAAFISGDGVGKPRGLLTYPQVADASHEWGRLGTVAGDLDAADAVDRLIDLIHAPKPQFRANARFLMNRRTLSAVRKLKDGDGRYLWQPGQQGGAATLLGYPVTEVEDMPDIDQGVAAIAFGDLRRAYLIVDRQGARVLRDPYSAKPYVLFYTTKRVGGGVQNFDAVKLMVF